MKQSLLSWVVGLLFLSLVGACGVSEAEPEPTAATGPVADKVGLIARLRAQGATVAEAGSLTQEFFSVDGQMLRVNDQDVQVYEYPNGAAAESEAAQVLSDGSVIGTTMVDWAATPHFYRSGKLIVLYVGDHAETGELLQEVLGEQFAGG